MMINENFSAILGDRSIVGKGFLVYDNATNNEWITTGYNPETGDLCARLMDYAGNLLPVDCGQVIMSALKFHKRFF